MLVVCWLRTSCTILKSSIWLRKCEFKLFLNVEDYHLLNIKSVIHRPAVFKEATNLFILLGKVSQLLTMCANVNF